MSDAIATARAEGRTLLSEVESKELLRSAGINVVEARLATNAKEAAAFATEAGFPVVMKIISPDIAHKSDVGGVVVGLQSASAVRKAYAEMMEQVQKKARKARIDGVSIQRQADAGTEVIIGGTTDPQFGPVLMFGLGGVFVEVLKDVAFRIVPIEQRDAHQMIREINGFPILEGVRGQKGADLKALERMLIQVSKFMWKHREIAELDLNPVFAYSKGAVAVDARIVLAPVSEPVEA
jgi:acetyl-CoA synthetase (ADP-forming)